MEYQMEQLQKVGRIQPKRSLDIKKSKLGIGFEKLDRNVFDPEKAYDKLALVGVKWVRIQSGWQRTEREKGVYDFAWLDSVVDNLIVRGMQPWICLCYGNDLYNEEAKTVYGAVGCPPIFSDEQKNAWANYVRTIVSRYEGRVTHWEVWNEPDGKWCWKHGVSGEEYGRFAADTANIVHSVSKDAVVIGGSVCLLNDLSFMDKALAAGMGEAIDAFTFHEYTPDESALFNHVPVIRALCHSYNPNIKIIQGESGSQSRSDGCGALKGGAWTQLRQAKQCVRHAVADLINEVEFTSYFSCMDMIEALNGTVGNKNSYLDYGYFGILGADFDENGFSSGEYTPKMAYYAYQNVCSVFAEEVTPCNLPILRTVLPSKRVQGNDYSGSFISHGFRKPNGSCALAYWNSTPLMTTEFESTISFRYAAIPGEIRVVDLLAGDVYEIPQSLLEIDGNRGVIKNIPITDYPLLLTFGDFI
ncbi:MAG: beta-galactosidase [Clostridia bacterium]|nr:beta-galactosidase [Clostridia bacterium]